MQTVYYVVLIPMVYAAFAILLVGTAVRLVKIFRGPRQPSTLQVYPEQRPKWLWALRDTFLLPTVRRHNPVLWVFLMLFHISFLFLIIGHLELISEFRLFQIIAHEVFLGRGFIGLVLSLSLLFFLFRRFKSPVRELSVPEDYYLLILLFLTVIFGSEMDWARRWYGYGELAVHDYRAYLTSIFLLRPAVPDTMMFAGHSFMMVLHVFFANLFIMFFPFSNLMHSILSLPVNKLRRG